MKRATWTVVPVLAAGLVTFSCKGKPAGPEAAAPPPARTEPIIVADAGLATPESVLHDPIADIYLVSNINGNPTGADDNGFISRVSPAGEVLELKWIDGADENVTLNAPKGTAIVGEVLYVADISVVRTFDRTSGAPLAVIELPGATFVNDVTPATGGGVYVSDSGMAFGEAGVQDTGSAAVYEVGADGTVTTIATGEGLMRPNGLVMTADRGLVMAPFGGATLMTIGPDGLLTTVAVIPAGSLDGVVHTTDGRLLVSSWEAGGIFAVDAVGAVANLDADTPAPADIGYDATRNRVLVPLFNDNRILIVPLS